MKKRILVLGAGFGGLELTTLLSESLGDSVETTLIDRNDAFVFGFSKLDVMFGHATPECVRMPYETVVKPGVRFVRDTITAIDTEARRVTTEGAVFEADVIVIALGADYDVGATPGLAETGNEFYSVPGAERNTLSATSRSCFRSWARYTVAIPPAPISRSIAYRSASASRNGSGTVLAEVIVGPWPARPAKSTRRMATRRTRTTPCRRVFFIQSIRRDS